MTLIDIALLSCPAEFRREFHEQIRSSTSVGGRHGAAFLDIVWIGLSLRAESFMRNLKTAVRSMVKSPVSTIVIVGTLAVAIGANVAVFTAFNAALLQPLPFPDSARLVRVSLGDPAQPRLTLLLPGMGRVIGPEVHSFAEVASVAEDPGAIVATNSTYAAHRGIATANFFRFLGAPPELGRLLDASDEGGTSVVISDALWRRHFASDPHVIGQHLKFTPSSASQPVDFQIVGVASPAMESIRKGSFHPDFWSTARNAAERASAQGMATSGVPLLTDTLGKLRPGIAPATAASEAQLVVKQLFPPGQPIPDAAKSMRALVTPLNSDALDNARYLWTLFAAVLAVLLVACLNVANLLLTRAASRTQELALRSALGASRGHIAALLIYESTLFSLLGVVLGAWLGLTLFSSALTLSPAIAKLPNVHPDGHVFAFTAGLMVVVALFAGVLPAMLQSRNKGAMVRAGTRMGNFAAPRLRFALGVAEIGLAFPLLVGAGLLLHSFFIASNVGHGFSTANLYEADYNLPVARYGAPGTFRNAVDQLTARIRAIPGVLSVGYADHGVTTTIFGDPYALKPGGSPLQNLNVMSVTPDFFATLGIPVQLGHNFSQNVSPSAANEAVVDQRFAKLLAPGDPLEKHVYNQNPDNPKVLSVVGVANAVTNTAASDTPVLYTRAFSTAVPGRHQFALFVRTNGSVPNLTEQIASITSGFDPLMVAPAVRPLADILAIKDASWRAGMILLSCLAAAALFLALVGIYGVTSYAVEARTRELGIRLAIGAKPRTILALVLRSQLVQGIIGLLIGIALSVAVTQALSSQLYEITPLDPVTYLLVALTLLATGLLAALLPGVRAMRVDPAIALRHE